MTSKISLLGMIFGGIFTVVSFVQYYLLFPDIDRIIAYPVIGFLIIIVSYFYNEILELNNTLDGIEEYMADRK